MRITRAVYGGGVKGGPMGDAAKMSVVKRLCRMLVRLTIGSHRVAEYDAMINRWERLPPEQMESELEIQKQRLRDALDGCAGSDRHVHKECPFCICERKS